MRMVIVILLSLCSLSVYADRIGNNFADTIYYNVADYGVKGDGSTDDLPALTALFETAAKQMRPIKISFDRRRTYRIGAHVQDLYGRILIRRASHITVDGNGCTLLIHPSSRAFAIYRSTNVVIRNFNIDYSPLPYTQGRVTKVDPQNFYLEFKIDEGFPKPIVGDELYYRDGKMVDCITANGKSRKFYQGHSWVKKVECLGNNTYGVRYALRKQSQLKIGDFFCMKVNYPEAKLIQNKDSTRRNETKEFLYTNIANICVHQSDSIVLENITSYAAPVMTILMSGCSHHFIRNCSIKSRKNRIVAGCSDGIHLKGNEFQPSIEHCYIERTMDDAIHIKISGDAVREVLAPNKIRIEHMDIAWDNTNLGRGKQVMVFNRETRTQLAECRISDYQPLNYREGIVTLDRDIPGLDTDASLYLVSVGEANIFGCGFGTQLQRAILTHQPTKVSDCIIEDNGMGFDVALMSNDIEGPPPQRLIIENCLFRNLINVGISVLCPSRNYDQKGTPQLIVCKCTFDLPERVPIIKAHNSNGIAFIDNTIFCKESSISFSRLIKLENTPLLDNNNNNWIQK